MTCARSNRPQGALGAHNGTPSGDQVAGRGCLTERVPLKVYIFEMSIIKLPIHVM